jgi:hypothetical protein
MRISNTLLALTVAASLPLLAQPPGGRGGPPQVPKAAAPIDLTGYWISIVNEDWRYRMVTPAPGDYQGVPINAASRKVADAWDPAKDEAAGDQCKSYGAPALIRVPGHLHITWQDDNTLKMETDAGTQTRLFHFGNFKAPDGPPTLQGDSMAVWEMQRPPGGGPPANGSLKVTTSHLKAGYLRKNGVPYGESAMLAENYDLVKETNGDVIMVITTVVTDPQYLTQPFIVTSQFKKQASDAGWKPSACSARW